MNRKELKWQLEKNKFYRQQKGLTQKELGKLLNMPGTKICNYEIGKANPKIETLARIAEAGEILVTALKDDILGEEKDLTEIERIYDSLSLNAGSGYQRIYDVKKADKAFGEHFGRMKQDEQVILEPLVIECNLAYEKQGFINGFEYAKRLLMS